LQDSLVNVALDPAEDADLRAEAAHAVIELGDQATKRGFRVRLRAPRTPSRGRVRKQLERKARRAYRVSCYGNPDTHAEHLQGAPRSAWRQEGRWPFAESAHPPA
jgi:hypothetical protein